MWAKVVVFLMKYKVVLEAAKAWWDKRKAKKNKPVDQKSGPKGPQGYGTVVERWSPKPKTRVRFLLPLLDRLHRL